MKIKNEKKIGLNKYLTIILEIILKYNNKILSINYFKFNVYQYIILKIAAWNEMVIT